MYSKLFCRSRGIPVSPRSELQTCQPGNIQLSNKFAGGRSGGPILQHCTDCPGEEFQLGAAFGMLIYFPALFFSDPCNNDSEVFFFKVLPSLGLSW